MSRAQSLIDEACTVKGNVQVGPGLYIVTLCAPGIARTVQPGQFVHMLVPGMEAHVLRRPFSVYQADAAAGTFDVLYQVVGFGTDVMTRLEPGAVMQAIGPIGTGWQVPEEGGVLLVGGGVGAAPLFMFAQQLAAAGRDVKVVLGAQTKDALVTYDDYCALEGASVVPATDDGSFGHAGFCTAPAQEAIESGSYPNVAVCGPEPLMKIVSRLALDAQCSCQVSLERRMACGIGACLSCVVDTVEGKKRACVDGPVFDASLVVW